MNAKARPIEPQMQAKVEAMVVVACDKLRCYGASNNAEVRKVLLDLSDEVLGEGLVVADLANKQAEAISRVAGDMGEAIAKLVYLHSQGKTAEISAFLAEVHANHVQIIKSTGPLH